MFLENSIPVVLNLVLHLLKNIMITSKLRHIYQLGLLFDMFEGLKHEYFLPKLFQTLNTYGWMVWFFPTNNTYIRVWNTTSPGREARIILCPISMQTPKNHFFDCGQTRTIVVEYYPVRNIFDLQNSISFPSKLLPCCCYYILCCGHEFNFTMFDFP